MGYPIRTDSATGTHAVTLKGHNSQIVFLDDEDHATFLSAIEKASSKYSVQVAAWTFMSNHVHMVMHGEIRNFAPFFQSLKCRYGKYFHKKYGGEGTLWKGRYHCDGIDSRDEYAEQVQYAFNNPVKAGIAPSPENYKWSNFSNLTKQKNSTAGKLIDEIANLEHVLEHTRDVAHQIMGNRPVKKGKIVPGEHISDTDAIQVLRTVAKKREISKIPRMKRKRQSVIVNKLLDAGATVSQVSRVTGILPKLLLGIME